MNRRNLWIAWAVIVGAAFGIVAITHAHGRLYLIIAIIAGAGYTVIAMLTRNQRAEADQRFPSGPEG